MNSHLRIATSSLLATLLTAGVTFAAPDTAGAPSLESRLSGVLGRPGGLTASAVGTRAESSSFEVKAKSEELEAAPAGVDQALVGYFPKLSLIGRYTRLSPIEQPLVGNLLAPPRSVGAGPVPSSALQDPKNPQLTQL